MTPSVSLRWRPAWRWALLTFLLVLAAGCGRKGPLFLPQEKLRQAEEALERPGAPPTPTVPAPTAPGAPDQSSQPH